MCTEEMIFDGVAGHSPRMRKEQVWILRTVAPRLLG